MLLFCWREWRSYSTCKGGIKWLRNVANYVGFSFSTIHFYHSLIETSLQMTIITHRHYSSGQLLVSALDGIQQTPTC